MQSLGEPAFMAKQLWNFLYIRGHKEFSKMTSLSKSLRAKLKQTYSLERPSIVKEQKANDGTHKLLLSLHDKKEIEAVYIPTIERGTICVSSQVGCNMGCTFCHTGAQKMVRNLTAAEIVGQVLLFKDMYNDYKTENREHNQNNPDKRLISNIVFMGMGELLQNYKEVLQAMKILNHHEGLAISKRKITLSTCGILPNIAKLAKDLPVNLAISLHAPNNALRDTIMPINKKYPVKELIEVCNNYYNSSNAKRITFEYVMLKGVNDTPEHARDLAKLAKRVPSKFNLIPFHSWDGCDFECSSPEVIKDFAEFLREKGYTATVRETRGNDILVACGQLKSQTARIPKTLNPLEL